MVKICNLIVAYVFFMVQQCLLIAIATKEVAPYFHLYIFIVMSNRFGSKNALKRMKFHIFGVIITWTGTGSGTLKNPRFCRVPGTGSEWNTKFEKKKMFQNLFLGILIFKMGSRTSSWNPNFVKRDPEPVLETLNFEKGSNP
jgi:hypothetical protein